MLVLPVPRPRWIFYALLFNSLIPLSILISARRRMGLLHKDNIFGFVFNQMITAFLFCELPKPLQLNDTILGTDQAIESIINVMPRTKLNNGHII